MEFSNANAKIKELKKRPEISRFLEGRRKVFSLDLASGHSCPFADKCLSKAVVQENGKRKIKDGENTEFRCFSASQEVQYDHLWNRRWGNFQELKRLKTSDDMSELIQSAMPENLGICRIHVGGDFFNYNYFMAWCKVASRNPDRLFYAYTKSLSFWNRAKDSNLVPSNLVITASRGGRQDDLIDELSLREAIVIYEEQTAEELGLEIDHDESHAAIPELRNNSFALLVHGTQPKGSEAGKAVRELRKNNVKHSYSRKKREVSSNGS